MNIYAQLLEEGLFGFARELVLAREEGKLLIVVSLLRHTSSPIGTALCWLSCHERDGALRRPPPCNPAFTQRVAPPNTLGATN